MEVLAGARYRQGLLQGRLEAMEPGSRTEAEVGAVTREALDTSGIEGERLNTKQVRESASRRLSIDLERAGDPEQHEDGLVAMLLDATARYREELTEERLLGWRSWLFPQGRSGLRGVRAGAWRTGPEPGAPGRCRSSPDTWDGNGATSRARSRSGSRAR